MQKEDPDPNPNPNPNPNPLILGAHDLNISQREANLFYSNGIGPSAVAAAPAHVLLQRIEKSRARAISDMKLGIRPK